MRILVLFLVMTYLLNYSPDVHAQPDTVAGWKAGVARVAITPEQPMWMAGYAARDHASEGTMHDLWAKALAMEDASGRQAILVTTDLLGFPKGLSDRIRDRLEEKFGLSRAQIILNSSHTHSGPVLENSLVDIYPLDAEQSGKIALYTQRLEEQVLALVGDALEALAPAQLYAANGVTRFQVNRRNNSAATLERQTALLGPNDYAVPVIRVENEAGALMAAMPATIPCWMAMSGPEIMPGLRSWNWKKCIPV
jgi:hypothetical protein